MKKDDELRKKLTALLEDYEAEPEEKTWENIRAAIQPERRRKPWLPLLLGAGLLLLTAVGWWLWPGTTDRIVDRYAPGISNVVGHRFHGGRFQAYTGGVSSAGSANHLPPTGTARFARHVFHPEKIAKKAVPTVETAAPTIDIQPVVRPEMAERHPDKPQSSIGLLATNALTVLPSRALKSTMPPPAEALYRLRTPYRPLNYWTIGVQLLYTGQTMIALTHDEHTATNIRQRRGMSPQRTGISVGVGYRRALRARFDVGLGAQWTNIPLETRYDVATLKEFDVLINGNDQFEVKPRTQFTVDQNRRLNQAALHAEAGYTFRLHRRYLRWGAGAGGNITFQSGEQPQFWWFTGLETPIGYSKYVFSVGYRRMQGQFVQPDQLLSTRLHAVEIGLKRKF